MVHNMNDIYTYDIPLYYRALSWSHDAWALIAILSVILVLGNIVLVLLIRITRAPRAQVFLQMLFMYMC